MSVLNDTAVFAAIVKHGGFSHAARELGFSAGLISRRIAKLEAYLGVSLIKRTTRQFNLTAEGEIFFQHSQRIQQELETALNIIQASAKKPKGTIRLTAPPLFGRQVLTPIITKFLDNFPNIKIDLILTDKKLNPMKEQLDLMLRGAGYEDKIELPDSSLQMKLLFKEKINLYASNEYLQVHGKPNNISDLPNHRIINYKTQNQNSRHDEWRYKYNNKDHTFRFNSNLNSNDIGSALVACINGHGIAKFTESNVKPYVEKNQLKIVLTNYNFGYFHLYAIYPRQQKLPHRTRLLLEFISQSIS